MTLESLGMFSYVEPDPVGAMLGTGYMRFVSPIGISGLAKVNDGALELLAVVAKTKAHGSFREFITQAKKRVAEIYVWEDWNPIIGEALKRYGFTPASRVEPDGEKITGWYWKY